MFASKDIFQTASSVTYTIARSVRLRSSATAYLQRTFSTPTSATTFTISCWVKRGKLGVSQTIIGDAAAGFDGLNFAASDQLVWYVNNTPSITTTAVYRDPAAWYHIVLKASGASSVLYTNGQQVGSASTAAVYFNTAVSHIIGQNASTNYLDGYLTEINFIDGQALTPSSFGSTNAITGVWQPAKYTGTYGTNGFYLNFSDNSNNTAATIGKDYSGNGNNWTPNNISVTAGVTYDSMTDVPTLTSATAANYAVSNINDIDRADITTSNGNLTLTKATASDSPRAAATFGANSGKFYAEITWTSITNTTPNDNFIVTGVTTKENWTDSSNGYNAVIYIAANNGLAQNGQKGIYTAGSFVGSSYGTGYFVSGTVIGIALNLDAGTVTFYLNNVSQGAITLPTTTQPWFFYNTSDGTGNGYTANWNFGQQPFTYTPPTGFVALNTYNLPAGTITTSGSFTGNVSTDGPFVYLNGVPTAMTINGNAVTFGTNADKLANGFKVRSSSSSYNASGSNTYSITTTGAKFKNANAQTNP